MTIHRIEGLVPAFELCDRMRVAMRQTDHTNKSMAELMGVRPEAVSTWINGHRRPSRAVLTLWAQVCGVDLTWLLTGQAPSTVPTGPGLYAIRDSNPEPADSVLGRLQLVAA